MQRLRSLRHVLPDFAINGTKIAQDKTAQNRIAQDQDKVAQASGGAK
jgi:hypothetical protein